MHHGCAQPDVRSAAKLKELANELALRSGLEPLAGMDASRAPRAARIAAPAPTLGELGEEDFEPDDGASSSSDDDMGALAYRMQPVS